jgi:aminoacylase
MPWFPNSEWDFQCHIITHFKYCNIFYDFSGYELVPIIQPGATDVRYVREAGIPAFGFSPRRNTPQLAHDHDEFVSENIFLEGIRIYEELLPKLFNISN